MRNYSLEQPVDPSASGGAAAPADDQLVRRTVAGDSEAFDALMRRHSVDLYRLACLMLGHHADAQDAVQETWLGCYQGLARFRGESSVRTWLVRILTLQVARHRRRESYRRTRGLNEASGSPAEGSPATAGSDARMDVADLLARLEPEHRDVLVLRELEGLTYEQIAQVLEVPRGTVESRLFRARQAWREIAK